MLAHLNQMNQLLDSGIMFSPDKLVNPDVDKPSHVDSPMRYEQLQIQHTIEKQLKEAAHVDSPMRYEQLQIQHAIEKQLKEAKASEEAAENDVALAIKMSNESYLQDRITRSAESTRKFEKSMEKLSNYGFDAPEHEYVETKEENIGPKEEASEEEANRIAMALSIMEMDTMRFKKMNEERARAKQDGAAMKIQSEFRRMAARKTVIARKMHRSAVTLQSAVRRVQSIQLLKLVREVKKIGEMSDATIRIQSAMRRKIAVNKKKTRLSALLFLQRVARIVADGKRGEREEKERKEKERARATVKIQSLMRNIIDDKKRREKVKATEKRDSAVTMIQRVIRRHGGRKIAIERLRAINILQMRAKITLAEKHEREERAKEEQDARDAEEAANVFLAFLDDKKREKKKEQDERDAEEATNVFLAFLDDKKREKKKEQEDQDARDAEEARNVFLAFLDDKKREKKKDQEDQDARDTEEVRNISSTLLDDNEGEKTALLTPSSVPLSIVKGEKISSKAIEEEIAMQTDQSDDDIKLTSSAITETDKDNHGALEEELNEESQEESHEESQGELHQESQEEETRQLSSTLISPFADISNSTDDIAFALGSQIATNTATNDLRQQQEKSNDEEFQSLDDFFTLKRSTSADENSNFYPTEETNPGFSPPKFTQITPKPSSSPSQQQPFSVTFQRANVIPQLELSKATDFRTGLSSSTMITSGPPLQPLQHQYQHQHQHHHQHQHQHQRQHQGG